MPVTIGYYGRFILRSPGASLSGFRLLSHTYAGDISPADLEHALQRRCARGAETDGQTGLPRVSTLDVDGRQFYLKLYRDDQLKTAARVLWANRYARQNGIPVARIAQTRYSKINGRRVFAILEEPIKGSSCWDGVGASAAKSIADSLNKWHEMTPARVKPIKGLLLQYDRTGLQRRLKQLQELDPDQTMAPDQPVEHALQMLQRPEMFAPQALSHGDINPHNFIATGSESVVWIDLERLTLRPIWHDICALICNVLRRHDAESIDLFERHYFSGAPELRALWDGVRADWFVVYTVMRGIKWLQKARIDPENSGMKSQWAQTHFAMAAAIQGNSAPGLSSTELMDIAGTAAANVLSCAEQGMPQRTIPDPTAVADGPPQSVQADPLGVT